MHYEKKYLDVDAIDEYTIDTNGVIWNVTKDRLVKGSTITKANRYMKVRFNRTYKVHVLVARAFLPNDDPDKTQVNHKNGNRAMNNAENLEWVTPAQNVKHAYRSGLKTNAGELNPISILTESIVADIWKLATQGHKPSAIIRLLKLNVCRGTVSKVTNGHNWSHVTSKLGV
jgi:hypothetical protein